MKAHKHLHRNKLGCSNCSLNQFRQKQIDVFLKNAKRIYGDKYIYDLNGYNGIMTRVKIHYVQCDRDFTKSANNHVHGGKSGCPYCAKLDELNEKIRDAKKKANKIHGDIYIYDFDGYKNVKSKIKIHCKQCDRDFIKKVNNHINGNKTGCPYCDEHKKLVKKVNEFKRKAKEVHNDKYVYDLNGYKNMDSKIKFRCKKCNTIHKKTANKHIYRKLGCAICAKQETLKKTLKKRKQLFLLNAKRVFGDKYDYSLVEYRNNEIKVVILCKKNGHEKFSMKPSRHTDDGYGCPQCLSEKKGQDVYERGQCFLYECRKKYNNIYDYSEVTYESLDSVIKIRCKIHQINFSQIAGFHKNYTSCKYCCKRYKGISRSQEIFIERAQKKYGTTHFSYEKVDFHNRGDDWKVEIICNKDGHGSFYQTVRSHLQGHGCLKCTKNGYSKKQIQWLEYVMIRDNIHIQHALNGGEFRVKGKKVDGYCEKENGLSIVFEFHGSFWHSFKDTYDPDDIHPVRKISHGEVYRQTLEKNQMIRDAGYELIVMWEHDWDKIVKELKKEEKMV